jgi:streptogramin lyase
MKIQATALALVLSAVVVFGQDAAQETPVRGGRAGRGGRGGGGGGARRELKRVAGPELGYVAVENPLHLPPNMKLASVADVAVNSKGHVFVFHRAPTPLLEFDGNGAFIRGFGEELTSRPHGVRIDSADNLWITDVDNHVVIKMNPQGKVLMTLGEQGKNGAWDEAAGTQLLDEPTDVAFAANGEFFVSQGHGGAPRILRFDKNGKLITSWGATPSQPGGAVNLHTIVIDKNGLVWAGDREARRMLVFNATGQLQKIVPTEHFVSGLAIGPDGLLYVCTGYEGQIIKEDWDAHILGVTGQPGTGLNQYGEAHHLSFGPKREMYVADTNGSNVQKYVERAR